MPNRFLILLVVSLLWASPLHAWYVATHRISSQIAWNELDRDVKKEMVRLLRTHPRFEQDFAEEMPDAVRSGNEEGQHAWLFQHASIWPDLIRDFSEDNDRGQYNRSKWHYVNWPLFLSEAEKNALNDKILVNLEKDPATASDPTDMNIFQAINHNASILKDRGAADGDRAIALCWIAHLVQDIHQPLHTTALFTSDRFSSGDRGGNLIPIRGQGGLKNLHVFWDSMVGQSQSEKIIRRRAMYLNQRYRQIGNDATEAMSIESWLKENGQILLRYVYTPEIRNNIRMAEGNEGELAPIRVAQDYHDRAQEVSEIRVVEAGFRLAYLLNQLPAN